MTDNKIIKLSLPMAKAVNEEIRALVTDSMTVDEAGRLIENSVWRAYFESLELLVAEIEENASQFEQEHINVNIDTLDGREVVGIVKGIRAAADALRRHIAQRRAELAPIPLPNSNKTSDS